ncbi:hypothetical protein TRFO_33321 [Tritrichomonas foetus]|uniref:Uncharacterized protein n=1 Tax=Tritrichomonas foetus TaxID=1144522 RepID=A0A1J4JLU2_9EUKA|nr:hypothetical protein TRFO_33321 [Tritrichomonas foetus]|eukprot:OHT00081.1 hypothetical protein TRFO_33321 [Tritrichomonas foetus]
MNQNVINQIRVRLYDICGDYRQIVHSISRASALPQKRNLEYLDDQTARVIQNATKFLKPKQTIDPVSEQQARSCFPIFTKLNDEAIYIKDELEKRVLTFNASLNENKNIFKQTANQLFEKYKIDRNNEIKRSKMRTQELKYEIQDLLESFDARLATRVGRCIDEKNEFKQKSEKLTTDFASMKSKLTAAVEVSKRKVIRLTDELKNLEDSNTQLLKSLEADYAAKIKLAEDENAHRISDLETTNSTLKSTLKESKENISSKLTEIRNTIKQKTKKSEEDLEGQIKARQDEFEKQLQEIQSSQSTTEQTLLKNYEQQRETNNSTLQSLRSLLATLNEQTKVSDEKISEKLKAVQKEHNSRIGTKDEELNILFDKQHNEVETCRKANEERIKQEAEKNEQMCSQIERELINIAHAYEEEQLQLENEVNALIRAKNELESQYEGEKKEQIEKVGFQVQRSTVANLSPQDNGAGDDRFLSPADMAQRFQRFDAVSHQRQIELRDVKLRRKNELIAAKKESSELLQQENARNVAISDEITSKTIRCEKIEKQILEIERKQKNEQKKLYKDKKSKVAMQKDAARQCKEELMRLQVDDLKKVQLSLDQAEHREKVNRLHTEISSFKENASNSLYEVQKKMEIEVKSQRIINEQRIKNAQERLDGALYELANTKENFESESVKEQQKWSELRIDIANSNMKVIQSINTTPNSRPGSSIQRAISTPSKKNSNNRK